MVAVYLISDIHSTHKEIKTIQEDINNLKGQADSGASEIENKRHKTEEMLKNIETEKKNISSLRQRIENLLPAATSAGLASNYDKAHKDLMTKWYWVGFIISLLALLSGYLYYFFVEAASKTIPLC